MLVIIQLSTVTFIGSFRLKSLSLAPLPHSCPTPTTQRVPSILPFTLIFNFLPLTHNLSYALIHTQYWSYDDLMFRNKIFLFFLLFLIRVECFLLSPEVRKRLYNWFENPVMAKEKEEKGEGRGVVVVNCRAIVKKQPEEKNRFTRLKLICT